MSILDKIVPPGWMSEPNTTRIFRTLRDAGHSVRFVGGCIRDYIAGRPVSDIDLATDATPDRVCEVLKAANIRVVPTGIEHGTIKALPDARSFEITTLRRDIETDGRHATVQFTNDWVEDAARRDFTFNALSAEPDGRVYDYFGGVADLTEGRVRFIGNARDRVAEDNLRVLRFFRFYAYYAKVDPDPESFAACEAAASRVTGLSGERIWFELALILTAPTPGPALQMMEDTALLGLMLPVGLSVRRLEALATLESMLSLKPDPVRRLTALIQPNRNETLQVAKRLRLSRDDTRRLGDLTSNRGKYSAGTNDLQLSRSLHGVGKDQIRDLILLDWADQVVTNPSEAADSVGGWKDIWHTASNWIPSEFPLSGDDVLEMGIDEGPDVGEILGDIEAWWIEQAFRPDRQACLNRLRVEVRRR